MTTPTVTETVRNGNPVGKRTELAATRSEAASECSTDSGSAGACA